MPTMRLRIATRWKESLQPGTPMKEVEAISKEERPPMIEPKFSDTCSHPNARPRLVSSVESATRD